MQVADQSSRFAKLAFVAINSQIRSTLYLELEAKAHGELVGQSVRANLTVKASIYPVNRWAVQTWLLADERAISSVASGRTAGTVVENIVITLTTP
jgi:hypothetical protein